MIDTETLTGETNADDLAQCRECLDRVDEEELTDGLCVTCLHAAAADAYNGF